MKNLVTILLLSFMYSIYYNVHFQIVKYKKILKNIHLQNILMCETSVQTGLFFFFSLDGHEYRFGTIMIKKLEYCANGLDKC